MEGEFKNLCRSQVQIHDVSDGRYTVWDVRGDGGPEKHGNRDKIQGDNKTVDNMTRLQDGSHSGVYDGVLEANAQYIDNN